MISETSSWITSSDGNGVIQQKKKISWLHRHKLFHYHFLIAFAVRIPCSSSASMSMTAPDTSFSNEFKPSLKETITTVREGLIQKMES